MNKTLQTTLIHQTQTVFSFTDLLLMWEGIDAATARKRVNYYVKTGGLYPIRRGLYGRDKGYDRYEMATKILTPAYISFESVLGNAGMVFQYSSQITVASYQTRDLIVDGNSVLFRTLKPAILTNTNGIIQREYYAIATPERALLDTIYLNPDYYFDQLSLIDWQKVLELLPVYNPSKRMVTRVEGYLARSRS